MELISLEKAPSSFDAACASSKIRDCKFLVVQEELFTLDAPNALSKIRECKFLTRCVPHNWTWIFLGEASCASPWVGVHACCSKIGAGDHYFPSWRYLCYILVPGYGRTYESVTFFGFCDPLFLLARSQKVTPYPWRTSYEPDPYLDLGLSLDLNLDLFLDIRFTDLATRKWFHRQLRFLPNLSCI